MRQVGRPGLGNVIVISNFRLHAFATRVAKGLGETWRLNGASGCVTERVPWHLVCVRLGERPSGAVDADAGRRDPFGSDYSIRTNRCVAAAGSGLRRGAVDGSVLSQAARRGAGGSCRMWWLSCGCGALRPVCVVSVRLCRMAVVGLG